MKTVGSTTTKSNCQCLLASITSIFTLDQRNAATCLSECSSSVLLAEGRKVEQRVLDANQFRPEAGKKCSCGAQLSVRENVGRFALLHIVSCCLAARVARHATSRRGDNIWPASSQLITVITQLQKSKWPRR